MHKNRFDHAFKIVVDLVVPEPQHAPAVCNKPRVAPEIVRKFFIRRMCGAVDFDDDARRVAEKIRDVGAARDLPPELQPDEAMCAQGAP